MTVVEERMKRTGMFFAVVLIALSGCRKKAEPANTLFVSGRIDGDTVDISSTVIQVKGQLLIEGFGDSGSITCTGSLQMWSVAVQVVIGGAFKHGQASSASGVFDITDGTFASVDQNLKLGN